eukprot:CAMPEP_0179281168 /NCGR_PEP_ID=MMETSP0797-20121207/37013_1 /TAXON_ID=47934 /ORGANISM="Dinophysis acuminata, Strain DAEP01" /LENGTH=364 /DNA_ID=CAMNT_0020989865 /DNA_START=37 /DNA_END=1131 /DNA_ORIENTATION=-
MAVFGDIVLREPGRNVFVVDRSDLEVESASVSSQWTSESEIELEMPEKGAQCTESSGKPVRKRRQIRKWRLCYPLARRGRARSRSGGGSSSSSSSGGSSSTSTSSSSKSAADVSGDEHAARQKRQRLEPFWGREAEDSPDPKAAHDSQPDASPGLQARTVKDAEVSRMPPLRWSDSKKRYRCLALAPGFLSSEDIQAVHAAAQHFTVEEIHDRKYSLAFKHKVWRFDLQFRALQPQLYRRLLHLMCQADAEKWQGLPSSAKKKGKVYPEIEYIEYNVEKFGEACFIEPHVDNKSAVTLIAMLSAPSDYTGGMSCFRRTSGSCGHREILMQQGDVALMRGEKLLHWITPVTAGRRAILQIELSRV